MQKDTGIKMQEFCDMLDSLMQKLSGQRIVKITFVRNEQEQNIEGDLLSSFSNDVSPVCKIQTANDIQEIYLDEVEKIVVL